MKRRYSIEGVDKFDATLTTRTHGHHDEVVAVDVVKHLRRRGLGTQLLTQCCADADREDVQLKLYVASNDDGGPNDDQLREWYGRFAFEPIYPGSSILTRKPRGKTDGRKKQEDRAVQECTAL